MQKDIKQVICMKWGSLYGSEYVNRLYAMVRQQTSGPLRFVCLTDDSSEVCSDVECYPCPEIDIPAPYSCLGWRKLRLFASSEDLFDFQGTWLYLDLDVVITGSLDDFFIFRPELTYMVMQNWTQKNMIVGNTSVYRFTVGSHVYLLTNLLNNHKQILNNYNNSQTYISRTIKDLNFWPDEWCILFKVQCVPAWPVRFFKTPILPKTARVVAFPGVPNPHQALVGHWPVKRFYKRVYKFIRPTPWIKTIWDQANVHLLSLKNTL